MKFIFFLKLMMKFIRGPKQCEAKDCRILLRKSYMAFGSPRFMHPSSPVRCALSPSTLTSLSLSCSYRRPPPTCSCAPPASHRAAIAAIQRRRGQQSPRSAAVRGRCRTCGPLISTHVVGLPSHRDGLRTPVLGAVDSELHHLFRRKKRCFISKC